METIEEEVAAIAAIYCGEGECSIVHQGCDSVVLCLCVTPLKRDDLNVNVTFTLKPETYPQNPPPVSVQSLALSRAGCEEIKTFLEEKGREFAGMPMILDLLTALQEKESFHGIIKEQMNTSEKATEESKYMTYVLHIDHMRNRKKYSKTVERWCLELNLVGQLIFYTKWIFIILQGQETDIKTYVQRNRTQCVDVDSMGRSCKERLLSIVFQSQLGPNFDNFSIMTYDKLEDIKEELRKRGVEEIFESIILPQVGSK
ncbi:RWD domain-containing protein 3-like isoform X1 [Oratosquilla oratoria]|uniref:RWD domain-containing protein 3-like isoform X1 n=1 Tax=Oratosquilla oratoria TaxID=337810 RepID=UPI003F7587C9